MSTPNRQIEERDAGQRLVKRVTRVIAIAATSAVALGSGAFAVSQKSNAAVTASTRLSQAAASTVTTASSSSTTASAATSSTSSSGQSTAVAPTASTSRPVATSGGS
jgi:hypothetical protein